MSSITSTTTASGATQQPLRTTKETHPNLPPGLILGADGKPCKVCNSWQDWAKIKVKKKEGDVEGKGKMAGMGGFAAMMSGSAAGGKPSGSQTSKSTPTVDRRDCPPDTAELGRSTWTFLHTTAAYYPIQATPQHQTNMRSLLSSLSLLYPCTWCADDFRTDMTKHPPDLSGREGLSRWLCERHNEVNEKLGKTRFECSIGKLDERWKDGPADGRCD